MATWGWESVSVGARCVSRDTRRDQRVSTAGAELGIVSLEIYGLKPARNVLKRNGRLRRSVGDLKNARPAAGLRLVGSFGERPGNLLGLWRFLYLPCIAFGERVL